MKEPVKEPVVIGWSGGKDSALTLHALQKSDAYQVVGLLTTVTEGYDRISMHGVRRVLLEQQAQAVGVPLTIVSISQRSSNEEYEARMRAATDSFKQRGITSFAFGDIFLEDVRRYREERLLLGGLKGVFPLWGKDSKQLADEFIALGFRCVVTCVDNKVLDSSFAGREYDHAFLRDLPEVADPCGENGEFHTFVYDGPIFRKRVPFTKGEIVLREDRFYYCDLLPAASGGAC